MITIFKKRFLSKMEHNQSELHKFKKPLKELLMISPSLKKLRLKAYQFNNKLTTKSKKKMIKKSFKIETNKKRKFRNLTNNQIKKKILLKIKIYKIN